MSEPSAAGRVIAALRALDERSGGRRVAWTETWRREREALASELAELPGVTVDYDSAGNMWARCEGRRGDPVVVGSHLDCVPDGGWLDGALGVLAGAELMRQVASGQQLPRSFALVDWADEEGTGFGRSLLGSSAAAGLLRPEDLAGLRDSDGNGLAATLHEFGVDVEQMLRPTERVRNAGAYLELHIEQGPVLEAEQRSCAAVSGALGIRRWRLALGGVAAHAATPLSMRIDPGLVGARMMLVCREAAQRHDGRATVGSFTLAPGVPTVVPGRCELTVDLRHQRRDQLESLEQGILAAVRQLAEEQGCTLETERLMAMDPVTFDPNLVARVAAAVGDQRTIVSGPAHDAVSMARVGAPTAMLFVRSRGGISHSRAEDSSEEDLEAAFDAFARVVHELLRS